MYRDVRFRVWIKAEGKMARVEELVWGDDGESRWVKVGSSLFDATKVELMESTGLRDVHDQVIYEGDIVNANQLVGIKGVVVYNNCSFVLRAIDGNIAAGSLYSFGEVEVAGNIYQNPELLDKIKTDEN